MGSQYGLIGYPLGHSFSKKFFDEKFKLLKSSDRYSLFELQHISEFNDLIKRNNLKGINVTIPYKQTVIPFLHKLDKSAEHIGAVNVIKNNNDELTGYNTDYPAFKITLKKWIDNNNFKALVLGTGGASKAVITALIDLNIAFQQVSRTSSKSSITYHELKKEQNLMQEFKLIINTTPLGMAPYTETQPDLPYSKLTSSHYLYDLVYNPKLTQFLKRGKEAKSTIKNGLEMLHLQAELAWNIWNS